MPDVPLKGEVEKFRKAVWKFYEAHGRHTLPWRKTRDPYKILVSEVMLQQTQVERVIAFYEAWMKAFPTVDALAKAAFSEVLTEWQGLGYNRRAKKLHEAAKELSKLSKFPESVEELEKLPGVGSYTARAVAAFAHNKDVVLIETNIRTAVIHHFFRAKNTTIYSSVSDEEIREVVEKAHPKGRAREWYAALMDYGSHLKRSGVKLNSRAKGYKKQSTFKGSKREARGAVLKALVEGPCTSEALVDMVGAARRTQVREAIKSLTDEGMIVLSRGKLRLPN